MDNPPAGPTVSILTPFLNPGPYLAEAIGSVRSQTFQDWELLLIDDGSDDESNGIAQEAARADTRIRLIPAATGSAKGAAAARNRGLSAAQGRLVAFLDADDLLEPCMLSRHVDLFDCQPQAAMVYGPTRWWHPGQPTADRTEDMGLLAGRLHEPPSLVETVILLCDSPVPCTCGVTIRRDLLQQLGGFDEGFQLYEDQTAWVKIMLDHPVYVDDVPVAVYRQHAASVSSMASETGEYRLNEAHPSRTAFLDWTETRVCGHPQEDRMKRAIAKARWRMRHQDKRWYRAWRRIRRISRRLTGCPN